MKCDEENQIKKEKSDHDEELVLADLSASDSGSDSDSDQFALLVMTHSNALLVFSCAYGQNIRTYVQDVKSYKRFLRKNGEPRMESVSNNSVKNTVISARSCTS